MREIGKVKNILIRHAIYSHHLTTLKVEGSGDYMVFSTFRITLALIFYLLQANEA